MRKLVHVNGYVKSDGTEVKDYYRWMEVSDHLLKGGIANDYRPLEQYPVAQAIFDDKPIWADPSIPDEDYDEDDDDDDGPFDLPDGVPKTTRRRSVPYEEDDGDVNLPTDTGDTDSSDSSGGDGTGDDGGIDIDIDGVLDVVDGALKVIEIGITVYEKLEAAQQVEKQVGQTVVKLENQEKELIDELTKSDGPKYNKTYKKYDKVKQTRLSMDEVRRRIHNAARVKDLHTITRELENLKTDYNQILKENRQNRPLPNPETPNDSPFKLAIQKASPFYQVSQIPRKLKQIPRRVVDTGMIYYGKVKNAPDAKELWKFSSHDGLESRKYVNKNGYLVYSIFDIPDRELRGYIWKKVKEQLGVMDCAGIVYKSHSNLAKQIAKSPELKKYFLANKNAVLNHEIIKDNSTLFSSNRNLALALGHADFVYMFLDLHNNLNVVVLDTYDMNANDPDWKVQVARRAQDWGTIRTFFILILVKIPLEELRKWL